MNWKLVACAPREAVEAALAAHELAVDWPEDVTLAGYEIAPDRPEEWQLDAYTPGKPTPAQRRALAALFRADAPAIAAEKLPETDWLMLSQQGTPPIRAGRFHVHTPDFPPLGQPGVRDFCIPAAQAFGTGQHATTAGCLEMLTAMKRLGVVVRDCADIGTGTGLLAFAALDLWPWARAVASDIDPVCEAVVAENIALNRVRSGYGRGRLAMVTAPGMDHELLRIAAPYDLLIANILAAPLIELAPDSAAAVSPGGNVLLAGLLEVQEAEVRAAYARAGFRLRRRLVRGDWSILWLARRPFA